MRKRLLRLIGLLAAVLAAGVGWVLATLPPRAERPPQPPPPPDVVTGAYHVHSIRSDGSGSIDAIAAAAARAGLGFVIFTDHGDATRPPDPPQYRHGVLCLDAVEVNSTGGHIVALGLPSAAPYPLAGEARDVIEDIHRLGGWAIASHPDSPVAGLRWRAGLGGVDGLEWLNADTEWRGRPTSAVLAAAARAWFRAPEAVAALFGSGQAGLARWDAAQVERPTFTIAALDAHARLGADADDAAPPSRLALHFPDYASMFRTVTQTVRLPRPPSGDALADAAALVDALVAGRSYSVVRAAVDAPHALTFEAVSGSARVGTGGAIEADGRVAIRASVPAGTGARVVLIRDGRDVASAESAVVLPEAAPGVYRVEARLPGRALPWIVSNAIRVHAPAAAAPPPAPPSPTGPPLAVTPIPLESWAIEAHPATTATVGIASGALRLEYRLGGGLPAGQYVALATGASGETAIERIVFTASSRRPLRLSVQVRVPGGADGQRWRRSVYVDEALRPFSVALSDLEPVDRRSPLRPISARVQSVLLVIDTLNARPGDGGELVLRDTGFVAGRSPDPGR